MERNKQTVNRRQDNKGINPLRRREPTTDERMQLFFLKSGILLKKDMFYTGKILHSVNPFIAIFSRKKIAKK
ncbi:MAG: hypothetical protein H9802_01865 [Candidatus Phocaeicola faecipullorum]|nr:hypothetical protein [Candidatus Phocaeicola faecipullorum]